MPRPIDVAAVLAAAGIEPGPDGHDPATLVAAIEGRGWRRSVEPRAGLPPTRPRYRALVVAPVRWPTAGDGHGATPTARGRGATETAALDRAVARLRRPAVVIYAPSCLEGGHVVRPSMVAPQE